MTSRFANSAVSTVYVPKRSLLTASSATFERHPALKPEQEEAITQFLMGRDVFVALPTGYGKSLCLYCCLPRVVDHVRSVEEQSILVVVSHMKKL